MAVELVNSTPITNMEATPPTRATAGRAGGAGPLVYVDGTVAVADAKDAASIYRVCRIPSQAVVKRVQACMDAATTTFTADIGVYDPTVNGVAGAVVDADLFASAVVLAAIVIPTQYTRESGQLSSAEMDMPLWQAAGKTADPGGYLDICFTATATTSVAGTAWMSVEYVIPGPA